MAAPGNGGGFSKRENSMFCTITDICGDYASIKNEETGVVREVALALLPEGINVGDRLKFENFEYTQV